MEPPSANQSLLENLALVYIALAFGTDQALDDAEMDVIARRLHEVQAALGEGTVLHAIKGALERYTQPEVQARVAQAVEALREAVPLELRARILKDLTEIGKADDRFLYAEALFIGELMQAWRLDTYEGLDVGDSLWSLFGQANEGWTPVHDLTLLYVTLAHRTDGRLSRDEVEAILEKLGEWMPGAGPPALRHVLNEVLKVYEEAPEGRTFEDAVEAIRTQVPRHQRPAILSDLRYVARADGVLLVEERVLIEQLAEAWEIEADTGGRKLRE